MLAEISLISGRGGHCQTVHFQIPSVEILDFEIVLILGQHAGGGKGWWCYSCGW